MSENLYGVLIGGLIGVVPSIVLIILEIIRQRMQERHEMNLKKIEIYEIARKQAIQDFMYHLGALLSTHVTTGLSIIEYNAAAKAVCIYVSNETQEIIERVNYVVHMAWTGNTEDNRRIRELLLTDSNVVQLNMCMAIELNNSIYFKHNPKPNYVEKKRLKANKNDT